MTVLYFVFMLLLSSKGQSSYLSMAKVLEDDLFQEYHNFVKPKFNQSEAVTVEYTAYLQQLVNVDVETQSVVLVFWKLTQWTDEFLQWNQAEYGGIEKIFINPTQMWVPDVIISNRKDNNPEIEEVTQFPASVSSKGQVSWFRPMQLSVGCDMNVKNFPWDEQKCMLRIESWLHANDDIDLVCKSIKKSNNYMEHPEWRLGDVVGELHDTSKIDILGRERPSKYIESVLVFNRKSRFYLIVIVVPTLIISLVAMFVFLLPNNSSEKIAFSMSMMLSFYINLLIVAGNIPNSSEHYPYIGTYYLVCIFLIAGSLLHTAISLTLHFKDFDAPRAPLCLRKLAFKYCLPYVLGSNILKHVIPASLFHSDPWDDYPYELLNHPKVSSNPINATLTKTLSDRSNSSLSSENGEGAMLAKLAKILVKMNQFKKTFDDKRREKQQAFKVVTEWQLIAKLIDLFFGLIFFIIATSISLYFISMAYTGAG